MEKILTIVIPTYNMQDYLRRCLDSLLVPAEQLPLMEVLVLNDGSKDNSSSIAHEYQDKYPQTFIVIDKENGNYGSCINKALTVATGKYIRILDADDWYNTENLSSLISLLMNEESDVVLTDFDVHLPSKTIKVDSFFKKKNYVYPIEEAYEENKKEIWNVQMHSICYKLICFEGIEYHQTEGVSYTDKEWNSMPWVNVKTLRYIPVEVYQYNLSREGQTCDKKVFLKKIPEQIIGIRNCLLKADVLFCKVDDFHKQLLFETIAYRIQSLYHYIKVDVMDNPQFIIDFDKELVKRYPQYAELIETDVMRCYYPYRYIKKWRESDYASIPFLIKFSFLFVRKSVGLSKRMLNFFGLYQYERP